MIFLQVILFIAAAYLCIGLVFSLAFVTKGVTRVDEGARGSGWGFRVIIIPGTVVFWPLLLQKWKAAIKNKEQ